MAGRLFQQLQSQGVAPEEIDTVVLTHLHADHVGWNIQEENGRRRLTFPRARYIVHQADWDAFHQEHLEGYHDRGPGYPARQVYVEKLITPLQTLGALDLTAGDCPLTDDLTLLHTPGHSPGPMSILISSGGERAIILGDVLLHPAQVTEPDWTPIYDMDGKMARWTRKQLLDRIEAEGMTVAACHFPGPGFGRVVRLEGRRYWQAL